ncbi:MAG: carbon-nitrogen hydrolase family protein [Planctomycetaceae bacterium]
MLPIRSCRLPWLQLTGLVSAVFLSPAIPTSADDAVGVDRDLVKVAAVQIIGYDKGDLPREGFDPAAQMISYIDKAGGDGAQLVVFPEYVLGHIRVPGPETERIAARAKANSIYVIVGCWEEFPDGTFANTALIFGRTGEIVGKYRKTHAAVDHFEGSPPWTKPLSDKSRDWMLQNDPEWVMEAGQDLPVFELDFGKVGIMTCYDGWFPEPPRVMSLKGAELIVWINGRGGSVEDFIVKSTMFQSHVAMITTNQAYGGGTMIADTQQWPARIIARCPDQQEAWISGTINLKQVRQVRASSRNFAQRRPDLYGRLATPEAAVATDSNPK